MSTTHIDRATVPAYQQAVAILIKLASPLFRRATANDEKLDRVFLHHWVSLRLVIDTITFNRSRSLSPDLQRRMIAALAVCRELPTPVLDVEHCICDVPSLLDQLSEVLTAETWLDVRRNDAPAAAEVTLA